MVDLQVIKAALRVDGELCEEMADDLITEVEQLQRLADVRLETIRSMSRYLDDVAEALGVTRPSTPIEGAGAVWRVMEAIHDLTGEVERLTVENVMLRDNLTLHRYSHDEIEAACGGEIALNVRSKVLARRARIEAEAVRP